MKKGNYVYLLEHDTKNGTANTCLIVSHFPAEPLDKDMFPDEPDKRLIIVSNGVNSPTIRIEIYDKEEEESKWVETSFDELIRGVNDEDWVFDSEE
jgi:hypothetical protein